MGAISSKGTANMSCITKARRSAGFSLSSTTSSARPTESARSASCSGSIGPSRPTVGSGDCGPTGSSGRALRERSMSRHTRATTVVSHPLRFSTSLVSERLRRSQASWTASSASLNEPSIRYATPRRCGRLSSNGLSRVSRSSTSHPLPVIRHGIDGCNPTDVTRRQ